MFAVGDWVLVEPRTEALVRRLTRRMVVERHVPGSASPHFVAANVDTRFIVTSHNADFNLDCLERYLALAIQGGVDPVILLTKGDTTTDTESHRIEAAALKPGLTVLTLDPRSAGTVDILAPWYGFGRTVALVGSSGVGKSTLVNTLSRPDRQRPQLTGSVRSHDDKGRHTTTARSLHADRGRRLGHRHTGHAHAQRRRCGPWDRSPVRRNHRACPSVQVRRSHTPTRAWMRGPCCRRQRGLGSRATGPLANALRGGSSQNVDIHGTAREPSVCPSPMDRLSRRGAPSP